MCPPTPAPPGPVRPRHHDRGVPPDVGADPPLDVLVAGEPRLALRPDRVDVVRRAQAWHAHLLLARPFQQAQHEVAGPPAAAGARDRVERVDPLARLFRVDVRQLRGQPVADDGVTLTSGSHAASLAFRIRRLVAACRSPLADRLACTDQSSYVLACFSSLPNGNRLGPRGNGPPAARPRPPGCAQWTGPMSRNATVPVTVRCGALPLGRRPAPGGKVNKRERIPAPGRLPLAHGADPV